jgi:hypothetical protein
MADGFSRAFQDDMKSTSRETKMAFGALESCVIVAPFIGDARIRRGIRLTMF